MTDPFALEPRLSSNPTGPTASAWVQRWSHLVAPHGSVLDVACGSGRHTRWFHERGCAVTAVDRDAAALQGLQGVARTVVADLEGQPWPLPGETFSAVVVTNYLWRALLPDIARSLGAGGVLIYETFAEGNASVGKPSNPHFLLRRGVSCCNSQQPTACESWPMKMVLPAHPIATFSASLRYALRPMLPTRRMCSAVRCIPREPSPRQLKSKACKEFP